MDRLELLPDAERRLVVEEWNGTEAAYPREACVHELFEAQAERTPARSRVVFEDETLTYAELNARANRLAHHLRALGVGPDARVALCVERGVEMVVAMLAVLKAGGAYVPLDPSYPDERLRYMLADSRPAVLLASRSQAERFAAAGVPVLDPANEAAWAHLPATDPRPAGLSPDHLGYVIYTSGSTGRPKGVAVPHRGVVEPAGGRPASRADRRGRRVQPVDQHQLRRLGLRDLLRAAGRRAALHPARRGAAGGGRLPGLDAGARGPQRLPAAVLLSELRERVSRSPERTRLRRLLVGVEPIAEPLLAEIRRERPRAADRQRLRAHGGHHLRHPPRRARHGTVASG